MRSVDMQDFPHEAAITVMNTSGVTIQNLAVDATNNTVSGCGLPVSAIHFLNSSGKVYGNAITGAVLHDVQTCSQVLGNGFGVRVDSDGTQPGPFEVTIEKNSIHDYTADGVFAVGPGAGSSTAPVTVHVRDNSISGIGPGIGTPQFGVFIHGAVGKVSGNTINEGTCGTLAIETDCITLRSEGVTLRVAEAGTVVDHNIIMKAQSGIFIKGGTQLTISNNVIGNIEGADGIDIQGVTNSLFDGNTISNALPLSNQACGIFEDTGTKVSGNIILNTTVNDAYCGVTYVSADQVLLGSYFNTLYTDVNGDLNPNGLPATEPGQPGATAIRSRRLLDWE